MSRSEPLPYVRWLAFLIALAAWAPRANAELPGWLTIAEPLARPHEIEAEVAAAFEGRTAEWAEAGFGYVELLSKSEIELGVAEELVFTRTFARGFVSHAGAQQAGTLEIPVATSRSRLTLMRVYLLLPDGTRADVDSDSIQVTDPLQPDLFSDEKIVSIPLQSIVPGAIAIAEYRVHRRLEGDPLPWGMILGLRNIVPVVSQELILRTSGDPDRIAWATDDPELDCRETREVALLCRRGEAPAIPLDPGVRSFYDVVPTLVVAERIGWSGLARRVAELVDEQADLSDEMRVTIERIRSEFGTPEERARELYRVVANEVRYLGFEHGDSAVVPHDASLTWKRRFGDCKDKVTLFVAMARALGLDARPVLTSTSFFDQDRVLLPTAAYFDHMIVCSDAIPIDDGCVDVTVAGSPAELPFVLQGGLAVDLSRREQAALTSLARRKVLWEVGIDRTLSIDCTGRVQERVERRQSGSWGNALRSGLLAVGPGERLQHFQMEHAQAFAGAGPQPDLRVEGLSSLDSPWTVAYQSNEDRRVPVDGLQHYYDVDVWLVQSARSLIADNRHYDYSLPGLRLESMTSYALCETITVAYLGAGLDFESDWGSLTREYEQRGGQIEVRTRLSIDGRMVSPGELLDLRLFLERTLEQTPIQFGYRGSSP